jgi:serine protease
LFAGHGTHVAGTVGGKKYGVAKEVTLVTVKCLGASGGGSMSSVIRAINWSVEQKQLNPSKRIVANLSLGTGKSESFNDAVDAAVKAGIIMAVAAGNQSVDACTRSPGSASQAITVASLDQSGDKSGFSNYGPCVDVFAPGSSIKSASHSSNSGSTTMSGTSMASPHVAGVAALYWDDRAYPDKSPAEVKALMIEDSEAGNVGKSSGSPNLVVSTAALSGIDACDSFFAKCGDAGDCCSGRCNLLGRCGIGLPF